MQLDWWRSKSIRSGHYGYHRYFIKLYVGSALVWAMCGQSSELGLYLWGNQPLLTVQGLPPHRDTLYCPRAVGGTAAVATGISNSPTARGHTHRPRVVHIGPTLAPEAILFESPCRAHSETKIAQIICQGRDFNHLFYYS